MTGPSQCRRPPSTLMTMTKSGMVSVKTLSDDDEAVCAWRSSAPLDAAEHSTEHDRDHLVAERRHAQHLGRVLGVVHRGEPPAEPGAVDGQRHADRQGGDDQVQQEHQVLEAADPVRERRAARRVVPCPPSMSRLIRANAARMNGTASVSSAKISPRSEPSRNAIGADDQCEQRRRAARRPGC